MSQEKINKLPKFDGSDLIVIRLCAMTFIAWAGLLSYKYFFFGYTDWDLALYSQVMWNLCHHSLHNSLFGMNFLANHAEYISFFIIPIYFIDPHPLTLVFLKVFSFVSGAYILYLLAKRVLPATFAIFFTFLYLIFPANIYAMLHEFHFETLSIGLLFLLFYFYRAQKFIPFCLTMFFVGIIKENVPPIIVAFGVYSLFSKKGRDKVNWGIIPILFGLSLFYLSLFVIMPALRADLGSSNQYIGQYSQVGVSLPEIIMNLLLHPEKLIKIIAQPHNVLYLHDLFSPLIYLSFLSPHILFLISPILLQNLLSSTASQQTIFFHYSATIVPFIFLSALESLGTIVRKRNTIFFGVVFCALVTTSLSNTGFYLNDILDRISLMKDPLDNVRWQMIEKIPSDKGVIATFRFLPALSQRKHVYSYLNVLENRDGLAFNKPFQLPDDVSYVLIDFADDWIRDKFLTADSGLQKIQDFLSHGWKIKDAVEDIVLFERSPGMANELVELSDAPFLPQGSEGQILIDNDFHLLSLRIGENNFNRPDVLPLNFYWKADRDIGESYTMRMTLKQGDRIFTSRVRRIGYTFYPTFTWKKDHYFKEQYWFRHPGLDSGKYTLEISFQRLFYDIPKGKEIIKARYEPVYFTDASQGGKIDFSENEKKQRRHVFSVDIMIAK